MKVQEIFTFSVALTDAMNLALVAKVKAYCSKSGRSFTWVVLEALKAYAEKINE